MPFAHVYDSETLGARRVNENKSKSTRAWLWEERKNMAMDKHREIPLDRNVDYLYDSRLKLFLKTSSLAKVFLSARESVCI